MSDPCILIVEVEEDLLVRTPLGEYLREAARGLEARHNVFRAKLRPAARLGVSGRYTFDREPTVVAHNDRSLLWRVANHSSFACKMLG
jgi:hypothetical protein